MCWKRRPNGIFCLIVWNEFLKDFSAIGILYSRKQIFHFSQTGKHIWDIRRNTVNDSEDCHFQSTDYLLWLSAKRYIPCFIPIAFLKISPHIRIKLTNQFTLGDGYSAMKGCKLLITKIIMWIVPTAIFPLLGLKTFFLSVTGCKRSHKIIWVMFVLKEML